MLTLAFDTCLGACSAALIRTSGEPVVLAKRYQELQTGHAELLMPMLSDVMGEAGAEFAHVSRIVVTVGPGTFTGVRVGVAAAKALALVTNAEVRGASSLHLMALQALNQLEIRAADKIQIVVAVDARRDQLYLQAFSSLGIEAGPPTLETVAVAAGLPFDSPVIAVGSGAEVFLAARLAQGRQDSAALSRLQPDISYIVPALAQDTASKPALHYPVQPLYLRPPDAKPQSGKSLPHAG